MIINVWLALRDDAQALIKQRLRWNPRVDGPYTGPVDPRAATLFRRMADLEGTQRLFRTDRVAGRDYSLWSLYFNSKKVAPAKVKKELDWLIATYPNRVAILGAWHEDGRQVGTQHVYDTQTVNKEVSFRNPDFQPDPELPLFDDRRILREFRDVEVTSVVGKTGTPLYPLHARLLNFMPDVDDIGTRPTGPSDVNLLAGQMPRSFF